MKSALIFFGIIVAILTMVFAGGMLELGWRGFFEPKHENINRQVFEETQSFVHGKIQYISRLRQQYEIADTPAAKSSLRSLILTEASTVDNELLPFTLQNFINSL